MILRYVLCPILLALSTTLLMASHASAQSKCENPGWNYCGRSIDKCCPPERPNACINLKVSMRGAMTRGGPIQTVPRGWSGCVGPATVVSEAAWANNCQ